MLSNVAFQKYQEVEHHADTSVFPLAVTSQQNQPALTEVELLFFYPWRTDKPAARAHRARFCLKYPCRAPVLAVLASLTAIIMLISMCGFARKRTKSLQFVSRKLAGNKAILSGGLGICGDTQGESDTSSSDKKSPSLSSLEILEPSAKMLKIVLGKDEGDEAAAGPSGLLLPFEHKRKVPAKREAQAGQPDQPGLYAPLQEVGEEGQAQPGVPDPSRPPNQQAPRGDLNEGTDPVPQDAPLNFSLDERGLAEVTAAHALLLLQQAPAIGGAPRGGIVQQRKDVQQPLTFGVQSPHFWGPRTQARQLQPPEAAPGPADLDNDLFVPDYYPASLVPPGSHSFFNLPTLQPGVVPRAFNLERACSYGISPRYPHALLNEVRSLLVKPLLTQEDANALVEVLERLVSHCYYHERAEVTRTDHVRSCDALAIKFLLLDAAISGFSALGQVSTISWWQQFARLVPHEFTVCTRKRRSGKQVSSHELLASALSKAVALLKTGVRPSNSVIFKLKYMIFCSPRGTERLHYPQYNPWRADCPSHPGCSKESPNGD